MIAINIVSGKLKVFHFLRDCYPVDVKFIVYTIELYFICIYFTNIQQKFAVWVKGGQTSMS